MEAPQWHLEAKARALEHAEESLRTATRRRERWKRLSAYPVIFVVFPAIVYLLSELYDVDVLESKIEDKTLILVENVFLWVTAALALALLLTAITGFFKRHAAKIESRAYRLRDSAWRDWQDPQEERHDQHN